MTIQRVIVPAVQAWDSTYTRVCQDVAFILASKFFEGAGIFPANPIISARTSAMMGGATVAQATVAELMQRSGKCSGQGPMGTDREARSGQGQKIASDNIQLIQRAKRKQTKKCQ